MRIGPTAIAGFMLALSLFGAPLAAHAQQVKRPYRIGVLHTGFFEEVPSVAGLRTVLKALGLEEGRGVTFAISFTRGKLEEAPSVAASLVKITPDLLVAQQKYSARALKAATLQFPVVFVEVGDPLTADLARHRPYVIVAVSTPAAVAAKQATQSVPIVMLGGHSNGRFESR